jgi:hypothetical protein
LMLRRSHRITPWFEELYDLTVCGCDGLQCRCPHWMLRNLDVFYTSEHRPVSSR